MSDENEKIHEVRYEALAQLMAQNQEDQKDHWKRFEKNFDEFKKILYKDLNELKDYNTKQNGHIQEAIHRLNVLEKADATHLIDCPLNEKVRTLEDAQESNKAIKRWVKTVLWSISIILGIIWILFQVAIRIYDIPVK